MSLFTMYVIKKAFISELSGNVTILKSLSLTLVGNEPPDTHYLPSNRIVWNMCYVMLMHPQC